MVADSYEKYALALTRVYCVVVAWALFVGFWFVIARLCDSQNLLLDRT